jgi:hypothetical protein
MTKIDGNGICGLLTFCLLLIVGCRDTASKPTAHLQGTVTIGGKEVPADADAIITFNPATVDQSRSSSSRIENGKFSVPDAPVGRVIVGFIIQQPTGEMKAFAPGARPEMQYRNLVPKEKQKGIEIEIKGDQSDLTFNL